MSEEKWLKDIKRSIDVEVELNIESLIELAERNDIEVGYVLETYRDKMTYRINKIVNQSL